MTLERTTYMETKNSNSDAQLPLLFCEPIAGFESKASIEKKPEGRQVELTVIVNSKRVMTKNPTELDAISEQQMLKRVARF